MRRTTPVAVTSSTSSFGRSYNASGWRWVTITRLPLTWACRSGMKRDVNQGMAKVVRS